MKSTIMITTEVAWSMQSLTPPTLKITTRKLQTMLAVEALLYVSRVGCLWRGSNRILTMPWFWQRLFLLCGRGVCWSGSVWKLWKKPWKGAYVWNTCKESRTYYLQPLNVCSLGLTGIISKPRELSTWEVNTISTGPTMKTPYEKQCQAK